MTNTPETDLENEALAVLLKFSDRIDRTGIKLVAAAISVAYARGVKDEREACARLADELAKLEEGDLLLHAAFEYMAASIRARIEDTPD